MLERLDCVGYAALRNVGVTAFSKCIRLWHDGHYFFERFFQDWQRGLGSRPQIGRAVDVSLQLMLPRREDTCVKVLLGKHIAVDLR